MGVQMKKLINWELFGILLGASIFSIIAIIPYVLTLQANLLSKLPHPSAYVAVSSNSSKCDFVFDFHFRWLIFGEESWSRHANPRELVRR
jgi:hypothetical protein